MEHHLSNVTTAMHLMGYGTRAAESVARKMDREGYCAPSVDTVITWTAANEGRW